MSSVLRRAILLSIVICCTLWAPLSFAAPPGKAITRADLASAYLRFERACRAHPLPKADLAEANQRFDRASFSFFGGNYAAAIQEINALTASVLPEAARSPAAQLAASLKVFIDPPTYLLGSPTPPVAHIYAIYPLEPELADATELTLRLHRPTEQENISIPFTVEGGATKGPDIKVPLGDAAARMSAGRYDVCVATADGVEIPARKLTVVEQSLDEVRKANEVKLAAITATTPAKKQALATCRARNRLLTDTPAEDRSAQFLADGPALVPQISAEIKALEKGRDPYYRRVGDIWRVFLSETDEIPVRVYAPAAAQGSARLPLLVVLHGAGGDENMFLDGYGAGRIKELADQHGFLVASPLSYPFMRSPKVLDRLVHALACDYAIDLDRVYVLGHSLGAGAAANLARARSKSLAAVCCLCGGGSFSSAKSLAPTLVIGAELDLLVNAGGLERAAQAAAAKGLPVEFRQYANYGHTLVVGEALPEATAWLLRHHRSATSRPSTQPAPTSQPSDSPTSRTSSMPNSG